jgi:hypothetical protein
MVTHKKQPRLYDNNNYNNKNDNDEIQKASGKLLQDSEIWREKKNNIETCKKFQMFGKKTQPQCLRVAKLIHDSVGSVFPCLQLNVRIYCYFLAHLPRQKWNNTSNGSLRSFPVLMRKQAVKRNKNHIKRN